MKSSWSESRGSARVSCCTALTLSSSPSRSVTPARKIILKKSLWNHLQGVPEKMFLRKKGTLLAKEHRCTDCFKFEVSVFLWLFSWWSTPPNLFYLKYFFSGECHWDQVSFLFCTRTSLMKVCVENLESQLPVLDWLFAELKVWWTVVLWEQRWESFSKQCIPGTMYITVHKNSDVL